MICDGGGQRPGARAARPYICYGCLRQQQASHMVQQDLLHEDLAIPVTRQLRGGETLIIIIFFAIAPACTLTQLLVWRFGRLQHPLDTPFWYQA